MRAALYVVGLAFGRVRRRSSGALLAAVGIAIGTAVLVGVLAGTKIAQDRSVSQAVDRIPAASRSVRAVWFGVPVGSAQAYPALDATVRVKFESIGLPGPTPIVLFRESTVAGHFVSLAGVKGLAPYVHVTSGRLPRTCTPARCEVLLLRGTGTLPNAPGLRLVRVGTGTLRSSQLFGDFLAPTDNALEDRELAPALQQGASYHRPLPAPLVVAEGIEALTRAPATANTYRSYAWMWPLAAGRPRLWEIDGLVSRSERARAALSGDSIGYSVQAPVEELRATEASATVAGRRLLLVGGEAAALLFAFAVLAARSMRRDLEAARRRLTWYGARRWQLRLLTVTESAIVAVAGAVIGWLVGVVVGGLAASRAGAPVGAVLRESVLSPAGLAVAAGVVVLATLVVAVATSMPARDESRLGPLDLAAAGSIALVVVALLGGAADQSRLAESQNAGLVLLLLPGLIAFAAAVAAARLFGPLVRLAGRLLHRSVGARLAAVTLGRGPGAAAVTVAFLTLAFALALLAEGYRATLVQAESDQASFAVPLDILVREDLKSLIPVLDAAPLRRYSALAGGSDAVPVVRIRGSVGECGGSRRDHRARPARCGDEAAARLAERLLGRLAGVTRCSADPTGRRGGEGDPARLAPQLRCRVGSRRAPGDDRHARWAVHVRRARPARGRCPDALRSRAAAPTAGREARRAASSCRRDSSTGEPTQAAHWQAPCGSAALRRRRGSARVASSCAPTGTASSSRTASTSRTTRGSAPGRRPTRPRPQCS